MPEKRAENFSTTDGSTRTAPTNILSVKPPKALSLIRLFALTHQKHFYPNSAYKSLSDELRNNKDLALLEFQAPQPSLDGFTDELLDDDDIAMKLIENEDITWMFYKMSERIKRKYLDKLPERTRQNIKKELHIE